MALAGLFIHDRTVPVDLHSLTIVTLVGRYEFDPAMPVPMVVPVDERLQPSPLVPSRMPEPPLPANALPSSSCRGAPRECPAPRISGPRFAARWAHSLPQVSHYSLAVTAHWSCPQAPGFTNERGDIFPENGGSLIFSDQWF